MLPTSNRWSLKKGLSQLPFSCDKSGEHLLQVLFKNPRRRHEKEVQEAIVSLAKGTSVDPAVVAVLPDMKIGTKFSFLFFFNGQHLLLNWQELITSSIYNRHCLAAANFFPSAIQAVATWLTGSKNK